MQNHKTLQLTQRLSCTAFELSVGQLLSLLWLMGDYHYPEQITEFGTAYQADLIRKADELLQFNPPTPIKKLSNADLQAAIDIFFQVNAAFFSPEKTESENNQTFGEPLRFDNETSTGRDVYNQLSGNVSLLTASGHPNALDYPFSYFAIALEKHNEANSGK